MNPTLTANGPALSNKETERMRALAARGDKDAERVLTLARAADQENAEAQFYLAHSLQEGALGLTCDPGAAKKLLIRAAEHGHPQAQQELDHQEKALTASPSRKDAGVSVNFLPLTAKQQEPARFDDAIIRLAVRAYMLSMPIFFRENDLIALMADKDNKAHFVEGGLVVLYLKIAGSAMAQGALAFHGDSSAEGMFGTSAKTQQMAKHADEQMRSQGIGLGEDFLWLAKVLPPAAAGNWGPFQAHSQLSPYRQEMLAQIQTWRMNPQVGQAIIAQMQEKFSTLEQQVYDAVCPLDIGLPADYRETGPPSQPARTQGEGDSSTERNPGHQENASPVSLSQNAEVDQCRVAAEQGFAPAQANLGYLYAEGKGVKQDSAEAAKWYRKAAEQGWASAQANLGYLYAQGKGVKQDSAEAAKWYRKAAEQGDTDAQKALDRISGNQCREAAEHGDAMAQNNLGMMYEQGQGVEQNYAEAANWYRKAAEQGLALAQCNLGFLYAKGNGVEQNTVEAAKLHRQAAEQGCAPAQFMVGWLYAAAKNNAEAEKWYRKAAEQGNIAAQKELDRISVK
jgi:TPR repeat protein